MPHHYRITIDALDPKPGEGGHESVAFFASTDSDLFAEAGALRESSGCSALSAMRLAMAAGLLRPTECIPVPEIAEEW